MFLGIFLCILFLGRSLFVGVYPTSELSDLLESIYSKISGVCIYLLHFKAVTPLLLHAAGLEVSGVV